MASSHIMGAIDLTERKRSMWEVAQNERLLLAQLDRPKPKKSQAEPNLPTFCTKKVFLIIYATSCVQLLSFAIKNYNCSKMALDI